MPFPLAFQAAPGAVYRAATPGRASPVTGWAGPVAAGAGAVAGLMGGGVKGNKAALAAALAQKKQMEADAIREGEAMAQQHAEQMGLPMLKQPPMAAQLPAQLPPPPAQAMPEGPPPMSGPIQPPMQKPPMQAPMPRPGWGGYNPNDPRLPQAQSPMPQQPMVRKPPMQGGMVNGKLPIRAAPAGGQMMNGGTPFRYRMSRG